MAKKSTKKKKVTKKEFKAVVEDPKKIQSIFSVASALVDEVQLNISKSGINCVAIDSSRVGMLIVDLPPAFFSTFSTNEKLTWNVSIVDFYKIVNRAKAKNQLEFYHSEDNDGYFRISILTGKKKRTFRLRQKDIPKEEEELETSDREKIEGLEKQLKEASSGWFVMDPDYFKEIVDDAEIISDEVDIEVNAAENVLKISAIDSYGENESVIPLKDEVIAKSNIADDGQGTYAIFHLKETLKMSPVVEDFKFWMGWNSPLIIESNFKKDAEKLQTGNPGKFLYLLAPRIHDEVIDEDLEDFTGDEIDAELEEEFEKAQEEMEEEG